MHLRWPLLNGWIPGVAPSPPSLTGLTVPRDVQLRNLAVDAAPTDFVFMVDADFIPDPLLFEYTSQALMPALLQDRAEGTKMAYVVACVALTPTAKAPRTMSDLRTLFRNQQAYITSLKGHGTTRHEILMDAPIIPPRDPLVTLRSYEVCFQSQWEPYYILPKDAPRYDERFLNQGGDKQQHTVLLNALGCAAWGPRGGRVHTWF